MTSVDVYLADVKVHRSILFGDVTRAIQKTIGGVLGAEEDADLSKMFPVLFFEPQYHKSGGFMRVVVWTNEDRHKQDSMRHNLRKELEKWLSEELLLQVVVVG